MRQWPTPACVLRACALLVTGLLLGALAVSDARALPVSESEPNDTAATAQSLDGFFSTEFDANIGDTTSNTSTTTPHVSVASTGNNTFDVYSFTATTGARGIFDIDFGLKGNGLTAPGSFDSFLRLFAADGTTTLAFNDDAPATAGSGGSVGNACVGNANCDSYIEHTFATAGTYFIRVGRCCEDTVPTGATYTLQVSISDQGGGSVDVPEPPTLLLVGSCAAALGVRLARRRQARAAAARV